MRFYMYRDSNNSRLSKQANDRRNERGDAGGVFPINVETMESLDENDSCVWIAAALKLTKKCFNRWRF